MYVVEGDVGEGKGARRCKWAMKRMDGFQDLELARLLKREKNSRKKDE